MPWPIWAGEERALTKWPAAIGMENQKSLCGNVQTMHAACLKMSPVSGEERRAVLGNTVVIHMVLWQHVLPADNIWKVSPLMLRKQNINICVCQCNLIKRHQKLFTHLCKQDLQGGQQFMEGLVQKWKGTFPPASLSQCSCVPDVFWKQVYILGRGRG